MWRFCFARIRLNPLSGQILYHDSVLVIVSGFTSIIEDFVIRRYYQVTKLFCTKYSVASASSARGLRYFGSQADVAISVFREVSEDTMFPRLRCHFCRMFRIWVLRNVCGCMQFCGLQIICEILWPEGHICQRIVRVLLVIFPRFLPKFPWASFVTSLWYWTWRWAWCSPVSRDEGCLWSKRFLW